MNLNIKKIEEKLYEKAFNHIDNLTKPPKSLGLIEDVSARIYLVYNGKMPEKLNKRIYVFAGDHGVCEEGISAFPQDVTVGMVMNFLNGGAAINVFSRLNNVDVKVVDSGVKFDFGENLSLINNKVGYGTKNIVEEPAMTREEFETCIEHGRELASISFKEGINLLAGGEMGIGNTTPSSVLFSKFLNIPAEKVVGPGTGLNSEKVKYKAEIVNKVLNRIKEIIDPVEISAHAGGFEIAQMTGLILGSAENGIPFIVDGFISTAAALSAVSICPNVKDYLIFAHNSAEPFYKDIVENMGVKPLLSLGLRLGEGTGSVLAMNIVEASLKMFNEMATFESAGVSEKCR